MPKEAFKRGPVQNILPLEEIAGVITSQKIL
jgi:chemotaxis response regulator CheB